jgi:carboxypeptidase Taq
MGYFPTYSLGNVLSVQLWERALEDARSIPEDIANGRFDSLLGWLRENVHRHGRKFPPRVLVEQATGKSLDVAPYARYLHDKFSEIYHTA